MDGLSEQRVTLELTPKIKKEPKNSFPGSGNCRCIGPGAELNLVWMRGEGHVMGPKKALKGSVKSLVLGLPWWQSG